MMPLIGCFTTAIWQELIPRQIPDQCLESPLDETNMPKDAGQHTNECAGLCYPPVTLLLTLASMKQIATK